MDENTGQPPVKSTKPLPDGPGFAALRQHLSQQAAATVPTHKQAVGADRVPETSAPTVPQPGAPKVPDRFLRRAQATGLWLRDVGLGASGYVLLVVVVAAGFAASFLGLHDFGRHRMGFSDHQAWLVPVAIDGADIGLSVVALRAAMNGRSAVLPRVMIVACTSISSWINYTHIDDQAGKYVASLLPILAVILLEALMAEARAAYERRIGQPRPRLSVLRWVFDRKGTLAILRAYVLGQPLPEQMAAAAKTIEVEPAMAKPKTKRQQQRQPGGQPKVKTVGSLTIPAPPQLGARDSGADVVDFATPDRPAWITPGMTAQDVVFGWCDRNGPVKNAAQLTQWLRDWGYSVSKDYGRTIQNRWRREHAERRTAAGER